MGMEPDPYSDEEKEKSAVMHKNKSTARDMLNFGTTSGSNSVNGGEGKELLSRSLNAASLKLPQIKFNRKVSCLLNNVIFFHKCHCALGGSCKLDSGFESFQTFSTCF